MNWNICSLYRSAIFWFIDLHKLYSYNPSILVARGCPWIFEFNVYHFVWFIAMLIRLFYYGSCLVWLVTIDCIFWVLLHYTLTRFILLFWKCKTEYINLPNDFVSVVLHSKSNDFLGPTTVSILFIVLSS